MKKILFFLCFIFTAIFSFSQEDSIQNKLYGWHLLDGFLVEPYEFDTIIDDFQIYVPAEQLSISGSWLNNIGSPYKSNIYYTEIGDIEPDFIFDKYFSPYTFTKNNQVFYHSNTPYFNIHWTTSQKRRNENQLNALYAQNINKKWNLGMRYRLIASAGEFSNSLISQHSMNPFLSYTGNRYSMHIAFIRNKFKLQENAGIDTTNSPDPELVEPFLKTASSIYYDRTFLFSQEYKFGFTKNIVINDSTTESTFKELGRINHVFSFDDNYRIYYDSNPIQRKFIKAEENQEGEWVGYYDSVRYFNDDLNITRDSLKLAKFENSVYWTFKEIEKPNFKGRLTFGGTLENLKWTNTGAIPAIDSIYPKGETTDTAYYEADTIFYNENYNNICLSGSLDARTKMFIFNANAKYYLGDVIGKTNKADNYEGRLLISKSIMIGKRKSDFYFRFMTNMKSPSIFYKRYSSNHFDWDTTFTDTKVQEIRAGLSIPSIRARGEFASSITTGYLYFDSLSSPAQYDQNLSIMSVSLSKDFLLGKNKKYGRFFIKNKFVYQIVPNDIEHIISIPQWAVYHSAYYNLDFALEKYKIEAQFGYDASYSSKFRALGYNPVTGQFYQTQRGTFAGEYPVVNVFINARIKTVLLFFKYENLVNQFSRDKYYFMTNRYAMNTAAFRFGVSWRFKN